MFNVGRGLSLALAFMLMPVSAPAIAAQSGGAERPNIVLIFVDDLGYGETGVQGNVEVPTPHIESIARNGVRFTQGYVTAPFCAPSRAGLMTGRYQTRFGLERNPTGTLNDDPRVGLPPSEITLAEHLRDAAGYTTALIGKWHLGGTSPYHPRRHGFDEFFGFLHEGHFFAPPPYEGVMTWLRRRTLPDGRSEGRWQRGNLIYSSHLGINDNPYDANNPILRNGQPVMETEYLTDAFTREAVDFIDRNHDRPFFLYLAYNAVHSPLQAKLQTLSRFAHIEDMHRRIFAAMLADLDDGVGKVLAKLEQHDLQDRTIVFFISDNGGHTPELTSRNDPLRGGKGQLYEGGIRVPFLMQWRGELPAGVTYDRPVITLDVFATAAAAANAPLGARHTIDGVSLLPYVRKERSGQPHDRLYWRMGDRAALRYEDWKLVRHGQGSPWELYNLDDDISESRNLAIARPQVLEGMIERWNELNVQMRGPLW